MVNAFSTNLQVVEYIKKILEFKKLFRLLEQFYRATGLSNSIVDLNGNILHGVGWKSICTEFHRKHKTSSERCLRSDTILANQLMKKENYSIYICQNGMVDVAIPIIIDGVHVANLFIGQFFFETPDKDFFIKQAEELGFDKEKYLMALEECQVYSKDTILRFLDFLGGFINIISESVLKTIKGKEQHDEKDKRAAELALANRELIFQTREKADRAAELIVANKELDYQNEEKENRAEELILFNKELAFQNVEKEKRADELLIANKELAFQNVEKEKRADELLIANKELAFQNVEKEKRADELLIANKELAFQNVEKEKRAGELLVLKNTLFNEKQLLEKTLISIGDGVISTDNNENVLFINKVAEALTGWSQKEAFGKSIYEVFNIVNKFTRKMEEDIVKKVMVTGKPHLLADHSILVTKGGRETLVEDSAAPIINEKGKTIGVVVVFRDYTEKWERLKKIEHLSFHDEVTGLYNRRFYEEELKRMDTKRNLPLSLIMGDVNGLKLINDSFGHEVGDELLRKIANAINKACRIDDIIARLGGDEFIILLPNTNAVDSIKIIERIQSYIKMERVNGLEISVSFGTETKTDINQDINNIFKNTEDHLYRHKIYESSSMRRETVDLITNTLFAKNGRELIHSKNVSILAEALAEIMGLSNDDINLLRLTGIMHDIGKIGIPDRILNKDGKLTVDEYDEIKKHPEIGYRILSSVNEFSEISEFVLEHHERWDGTGYPQGLKGEEIKIEARMIAICDAFDAMSTLRTYRDVVSQEAALNELKRCSGSQFDPDIVKSFTDMIICSEKPTEKAN